MTHFERAVLTLREIGDRLGLAKALRGYGNALAAKADQESASAAWEEAAAVFRQLGASELADVQALLDEQRSVGEKRDGVDRSAKEVGHA
jgi:hypothetical protein